MFEFKQGNLLLEKADAIVNTVNCVGIMGKGIALQFKKAYPDNFRQYESACKKGQVILGKMFIVNLNTLVQPHYIINFPTKLHWKSDSKIENIEKGLLSLSEDIKRLNIKSIAIPPLGCGFGGLKWEDVKPKIESILGTLKDVRIVIFEPTKQDIKHKIDLSKIPALTPARAALIGLMRQYLEVLLDPFLTLLEIHKLMYFLQEAGENLRLKFSKASYGPYAENLRHVLNVLEGYYIKGYSGDDKPDIEISLINNSGEKAKEILQSNKTTFVNFNKVSDLIEGFESSFGLELLATVHWVVKKENAKNIEEIIDKIYNWNDRKKQFSKDNIQTAYNTLLKKGWLIN